MPVIGLLAAQPVEIADRAADFEKSIDESINNAPAGSSNVNMKDVAKLANTRRLAAPKLTYQRAAKSLKRRLDGSNH